MAKKRLTVSLGNAASQPDVDLNKSTFRAPVPQFGGTLPIGFEQLHEAIQGKPDVEIDRAILRVLNPSESPKRLNIPLSAIQIDSNQPRANSPELHDVQSLADSIAKDGLLQAIGVVTLGHGYQLLYGERRYQAHLLLGRDEIGSTVYPSLSEIQVRRIQLMENVQRKDLDPYREAMALLDWVVLELGEPILQISKGLTVARKELISILRKMKREKHRGKTSTPVPDEIRDAISRIVEGSGRWTWESFVSSRLVYASIPEDLIAASKKGIGHRNLLQLAKITPRALGCSSQIATATRAVMIEPAQHLSKDAFRKLVDDFLSLPSDVRFAAVDGIELEKLQVIGRITASLLNCSEQDAHLKRAEFLKGAKLSTVESLKHEVELLSDGLIHNKPSINERRERMIKSAIRSLRLLKSTTLNEDQISELESIVAKLTVP